MDCLVVEIGARRIALRSVDVREVVALSTVTPVPLAPPMLAGLTQVRGQIVPLVDLAETARRPRPSDPLVLLELGSARAALLVDKVIGVLRNDPATGTPLDVPGVFERLRRAIRDAEKRP
jgi:purine-binding chemotaxis protein CheW